METRVDFLFQDEETGVNFFVELEVGGYKNGAELIGKAKDLLEEAQAIAESYFDEPQFCGIYTPEEAEVLGYDTF